MIIRFFNILKLPHTIFENVGYLSFRFTTSKTKYIIYKWFFFKKWYAIILRLCTQIQVLHTSSQKAMNSDLGAK